MRLSGFASGLDVDSMVKELMKARRTTYDNMVKNRTKVEWQQEDYRTMSSKIVDFRNNKLASYNLSNAINAKTSEVSGETNALTMNSTGSKAAGGINVTVTEVATAANTIYEFNNKNGGVEKTLGELGFASADADNIVVKINGVEIKAAKTGTLSDLAAAINAKSSTAKASALYDAASGKFSITATKTGVTDPGTNTGLNIEGFSTDIGAASEFIKSVDDTNKGKNAEITVNGINYKQSSNRFSINGFDFTVKAKTTTANGASITAVQDTNKIMETIKSFVNDYNSLISTIGKELSEAKYRTYAPLSADEKKEMSDKEIELWEEKARSGTLRNDSTLSKFVNELRSTTLSLVKGIKLPDGTSVSIGITTGSYTEKGKLVLDETKLRSALESNPEEVTALFSGSTGVFSKMRDSAMTALTSLQERAGTSLTSSDPSSSFMENSLLSNQIRQMKSREDLLLDRLKRQEDQYYKQFTAMETAINKYNSQASTFSSF
ncbi:flagellar cap protein FliD [Paenibacillus nanensis]|uniref:Flagellar hook-associated protein 2 n=1 Tax=Paenibacillus nanensis TaxID=393251 RepID=A0A3A1UJI4_9BACL|nr:flagellar filament capping protein FliD [Paenibacillus nanensis]RIX47303.1 flagellar cap protein FliD [Paenibacillus nanensis]